MPYKDPARQREYQRLWRYRLDERTFGNRRKPRGDCAACGQPVKRWQARYCTLRCQQEHRYQSYVARWLAGEISGAQLDGSLSDFVRRYLIEEGGECCSRCGWAERHPTTGRIPLEIDHADGKWQNNRPENIRLLCPNCHALTPTYKALNKGNGRPFVITRRSRPGDLNP
jgi:hypothetical protein